jgi:hypothetical protein
MGNGLLFSFWGGQVCVLFFMLFIFYFIFLFYFCFCVWGGEESVVLGLGYLFFSSKKNNKIK